MKSEKLSRRKTIKIIGLGTFGILAGGSAINKTDRRHIITLSFDDGFEKSSIRTAEIYEKYGLSACINVIATAHQDQFELPNEYHKWPVGDFNLWNDLKKRGHEIMPHGYKHANLREIPLEQAQELVNKCLDVFSKELKDFRAEESVFNFPFNASTPELENWLRSRVRAIRTSGEAVNPLPRKDLFRIGCISFGPDNIDNHLEKTISGFLEGPPGWLVYNTHGLDDEGWGPISSHFLDELLDRLTGTENVEILPVIPALYSV
jgi:peptidoglycan/xylan/chitin deacetylase (PgdA/CDA1 family)